MAIKLHWTLDCGNFMYKLLFYICLLSIFDYMLKSFFCDMIILLFLSIEACGLMVSCLVLSNLTEKLLLMVLNWSIYESFENTLHSNNTLVYVTGISEFYYWICWVYWLHPVWQCSIFRKVIIFMLFCCSFVMRNF